MEDIFHGDLFEHKQVIKAIASLAVSDDRLAFKSEIFHDDVGRSA